MQQGRKALTAGGDEQGLAVHRGQLGLRGGDVEFDQQLFGFDAGTFSHVNGAHGAALGGLHALALRGGGQVALARQGLVHRRQGGNQYQAAQAESQPAQAAPDQRVEFVVGRCKRCGWHGALQGQALRRAGGRSGLQAAIAQQQHAVGHSQQAAAVCDDDGAASGGLVGQQGGLQGLLAGLRRGGHWVRPAAARPAHQTARGPGRCADAGPRERPALGPRRVW